MPAHNGRGSLQSSMHCRQGHENVIRTQVALKSLDSTMDKLGQDKDRSEKLLELLQDKMKMPDKKQVHQHIKNKSFAHSGFCFVKDLGVGRFGSVKLAKKKATNDVTFTTTHRPDEKAFHGSVSAFVAVRIIPRYRVRNAKLVANEQLSTQESYMTLMKQINALRQLDHPHICRIYDTFEDSHTLYIIMELLTGGTLLHREMAHDDPISEDRCIHILWQIASAMAHAHGEGILHQDLRPENLIFSSEDDNARVVVTDWSYCEFIDAPPSEARHTLPDSEFVAPEISAKEHSDKVDIWSIGVIAFALLTYRLPFETNDFSAVQWDQSDKVSKECMQFVNSLLNINAPQRPSAKQILSHPLLLNAHEKGLSAKKREVKDVTKALVNFSGRSRLQKMCATFAASHLSGDELQRISELFDIMDTNGDGTIDRSELERAFQNLELSEMSNGMQANGIKDKKAQIQYLINALDVDGSGQISYSEFLGAAADNHMQTQVELCYEAFRAFDADQNGYISKDEIDRLLHGPEVQELIKAIKNTGNKEAEMKAHRMLCGDSHITTGEELISVIDKDGNNRVSFDEFLSMMVGKPEEAQKAASKVLDHQNRMSQRTHYEPQHNLEGNELRVVYANEMRTTDCKARIDGGR